MTHQEIRNALKSLVPSLVDPEMYNSLVNVFENSELGQQILKKKSHDKKLLRKMVVFLYTTFSTKIIPINSNHVKVFINPKSDRIKMFFKIDKNYVNDEKVIKSLDEIKVFIAYQFAKTGKFQSNELNQIIQDWITYKELRDFINKKIIVNFPREWQVYFEFLTEKFDTWKSRLPFYKKRKAKEILKECPDIEDVICGRLICKRSFKEKLTRVYNFLFRNKDIIVSVLTIVVSIGIAIFKSLTSTESKTAA